MAQSVSVCIIAKNEEKYIETCMQALQPFDVEVVVVDTGSTDRTKEIARKYTENVYDFEWIGDFSAARNFAASKAKHNYIVALDCDEFIERLNIPEIEKFLKEKPFGIGFMRLLNLVSSGTSMGKNVHGVGRIYDKRFAGYVDRIHEQLRPKNNRKMEVKNLDVSAIHMGYLQSPEDREKKNRRNIELLLLQLEEKPNDIYSMFQLAQSYYVIGRTEEAYELRKKAMDLKPPKDEEYTELLLVGYIKSALEAGDYKDALIATEYFETMHNHADYMFHLGQIYFANGMIDEAIETFEAATKLPPDHIEGSNTFFPYHALSLLYDKAGEHEKAQEYEDTAQKYLREAYNL